MSTTSSSTPPSNAKDSGSEKLILYRGFLDRGRYVWSPFVTKLEFHLRAGGVPYRTGVGSPIQAPKGKIPYADLTSLSHEDGAVKGMLGDSALIVKRLVEMGVMRDLNEGLGAEARLFDSGVSALCDERLYFFNVRERWIDNFYAQRDKVFETKPYPIRLLLGQLAYRKFSQGVYRQGSGRHTFEEAAAITREIWTTINDLLEERRRKAKSGGEPFFVLGGERPTAADASVFGFVASNLICKS
ncbi:MAG: hypothetical protein Q9160_003473 [Pyrenula sp. 1 TL-2023]